MLQLYKADIMETMKEQTAKPCTLKELAGWYGVSTKTLRTWLQPHKEAIGERISRYFTALQVKQIFERLGEPPLNN